MLHIDNELAVVGNNGKYQQLLIWLVLLPTQLPYTSHLYCQLLSSWTPDHWCVVSRVPEEDSTMYYSLRKAMVKEYKNNKYFYSQCFVNRTLNTMVITEYRKNARKKLMKFHSTPVILKCEDGWFYNRSWLHESDTIVTEVIYFLVYKCDIYDTSYFCFSLKSSNHIFYNISRTI